MVIIPVCLFHQQLYNLKKLEHGNAKWCWVFSSIRCLFSLQTTSTPSKPVNYGYSMSVVCKVSQLCAVCASDIIFFVTIGVIVALKRNVIFCWMSVTVRVQNHLNISFGKFSLRSHPHLMSHLEATELFTDPAPIQAKFSAVPQGQKQKNLKVWIED
jgi:hypothetical protein